jgi:Domain of unknown function (DUF2382)/PRC-barrel domain
MVQDYDGAEVVDACGERIGIVERSYVDASETVRFVEVMIGAFLAKHRLIPLDGAQISSGTLTVPYTKDMIVQSPDASSVSDTLEGELLEQVQAYYARGRESTDVAPAGSTAQDVAVVPAGDAAVVEGEVIIPEPASDLARQAGEGRDRDDGTAIPIVEEETAIPIVEEEVVVVKRRVVKEVLRVRKGQVIEHETIPATVWMEPAQVVHDGDLVVRHEPDDT